MDKPKLREEVQPVTEGWCLDLYCKYTAGFPHDSDTWGAQFFGHTRAEARREAKAEGWKLHRDGTATCKSCAAAIREGRG